MVCLRFDMTFNTGNLIRSDVDPKFLCRLGKIWIMRIGIICIGRDWDPPIQITRLDYAKLPVFQMIQIN